MDRMPQRVVIHKRTPFKKDEIKGITDALSHAGIKNVDLVTIRMEDSIKCIDQYLQYGHPINAHFPVMRGICFAVSQCECLLWTHGTIDSVKPNRSYFPGGRGIPSPLRIIKYHGNGSMQTIAREILGFTKMNWNSFNFTQNFQLQLILPIHWHKLETYWLIMMVGHMITDISSNEICI